MFKIEKELIDSINSILKKHFPDIKIDLSDVYLEVPKEKRFGDYSTNIAMRLSKLIKKPPADSAGIIASEMKNNKECLEIIDDVKIEKPGFINFYLKNKAVLSELKEIFKAGDKFGSSSMGSGKKAQIEFVSANPTGPLTVAHGRQAAIGDSLARILEFCGYKVTREYYINDEGVQIQALGKSVKARLMEMMGEKCDFPENGYKGQYVYDIAKALTLTLSQTGRGKGEGCDLSDDFFMEEACRDIMETITKDLKDFDVHFDTWFSQKSLSKSGKIEKTLDTLKNKGFLYEQEGATWFKSSLFKDDKDRVVIKSDGSYTYVTPDMAYHREKFEKGYDKIIDILGPDHHGYIPRIRAACQALGYDIGKLHIMIAQLVTLYRSGSPVRMSTREGEFITLREVMDEIGKDAARFFFIMRKVESHLDFDLELAKQKTMDNPVYYIQYAHARIASVIEFRGEEKTGLNNLHLLDKTEEIDLIKKLMQYPKAVANASENLEPYALLVYLQELAGIFHSYYNSYRIVTDDKPLTEARLSLAKVVKTVFSSGLSLLGVSAPEKM